MYPGGVLHTPALIYGHPAVGTHPTGMHSCINYVFTFSFRQTGLIVHYVVPSRVV